MFSRHAILISNEAINQHTLEIPLRKYQTNEPDDSPRPIHLDDKHDHRCCVIPLVKTLVSLSAQVKILTHKNNTHNSRRQFWFIELTIFITKYDFDYSSTFRTFSTKTSTFSANYKDFDFLHEFLLTHQPLTQKPVNKQLFFEKTI